MRTRADGMLIFDDDMSDLIDKLLNIEGIKRVYITDKHKTWIRHVRDEGLRGGLEALSERQIAIIEALVFDRKSPLDVRADMELSVKEIRIEIRTIRSILLDAM
ncbi:hypothetical protein BHK98_05810 [Hornefia porci]|uniref:Uncharacterized protein n=1 Tax=Hornefia porci TaxID=2652292 RepID=A0A1Q9JHL4_9FIRM|nr:hypothetical protein [Hornefia porci]OLR55621.1 hypothetical protein BHK98_05810 [Hornefia porci]